MESTSEWTASSLLSCQQSRDSTVAALNIRRTSRFTEDINITLRDQQPTALSWNRLCVFDGCQDGQSLGVRAEGLEAVYDASLLLLCVNVEMGAALACQTNSRRKMMSVKSDANLSWLVGWLLSI